MTQDIPTFGKIPAVFQRAVTGKKNLMPGIWIDETVQALANYTWVWTEKINGTNVRVHWDGYGFSFGARKDGSEIPPFLLDRLKEIFNDAAEQIFEQMFGDKPVTVFGEGYGHKIGGQGDGYLPDRVDLILFDVLISGNYQTRNTVSQVAKALGLGAVPIVGHGTLHDAIAFVQTRPKSLIADTPMEGLVCRPLMDLRYRNGDRIIVKCKWKDLRPDRLGVG